MVFYLLASFLVGSAVGSFLNVVIDRTVRGQSILGRSYCDYCKATLKTLDLVPIVSFIALWGRCRYCRRKISWQYPLVEFLTALLFALAFWVLASSTVLTFWLLSYYFFLIAILIVVSAVDWKYSLIPTSLVFAGSLVALFFNFFTLNSADFVVSVVAAFASALFFLLIVAVTRGRGMGEGDIILAFLIGMVLGPKGATLAVFLAFLLGAVFSLVLIALGRKKFGQTVPFGPFLALGLLISLFWSSEIINWYLMLY